MEDLTKLYFNNYGDYMEKIEKRKKKKKEDLEENIFEEFFYEWDNIFTSVLLQIDLH